MMMPASNHLRLIGRLVCAAIILLCTSRSAAQEPEGASQPPAAGEAAPAPRDSHCGDCHLCEAPTREDRCLRSCTRTTRKPGRDTLEGVPDVVILDELEDAYLPVPFDHKGHATMAQMGQGCVVCHHYTPEGARHPACITCHDASTEGTDIHKPGLKGAYHQQCLNCHRDWIDETDCDICHRAKTGATGRGGPIPTPTKDDILGQMHPPIPAPATDLYRGDTRKTTGSQVLFRHQEHVARFGLTCVECHHEPSCARCHTKEREPRRELTVAEHHRPCIRCHKDDMDLAAREAGRCERCHWVEGQAKPAPFDHARTGWALGRFHENRRCRDCHKSLPFEKLGNDCVSCHSAWSPSTFDHGVTGQALDANHAEQDCELCHAERKFDRPPTCDGCHDAEDGIAFPARRPGPVVTSRPADESNVQGKAKPTSEIGGVRKPGGDIG